MLSSIKIDFTDKGEGLEPVIRIRMQESDDPRDGLVRTLFQRLGGQSSWLAVSFDHHVIAGNKDSTTYITLSAVTPKELPETVDIIKRRLEAPQSELPPVNFNPLT